MRSSSLLCGRRLAKATIDEVFSLSSPPIFSESISLRAFAPACSSWTPSDPRHHRHLHQSRSFSSSPLYKNGDTSSSTTSSSSSSSSPTNPQWEKQVIYRGRGIQIFRILVRFKIFQLTGVAALAVPITTFFSGGEVSSLQTVIATSLLVGSGAASTALWFYSRRYVGELSLLRRPVLEEEKSRNMVEGGPEKLETNTCPPTKVRFSVLDFWGNREDVDALIDDVVPPLAGLTPPEATAAAAEPFLPVTVSGDRQYVLSVRYGNVVDGKALKALLNGSLDSEQY